MNEAKARTTGNHPPPRFLWHGLLLLLPLFVDLAFAWPGEGRNETSANNDFFGGVA